ncbi:transcriptional regulator [Micromonospora sp. NPDC048830]|uniref:transcriptional regulator n=1 Tax=Micromonospora sp. NPDC048830 TaxID=3364257 RepID=UPI003721F2FD
MADAVNAHLHAAGHHHGCIDANYVGKLEPGQIRWPTAAARAAFRAVLGVPTDAVLGFYIVRATAALTPAKDSTPPIESSPGSKTDWQLDQAIADTDEVNRRELLRLLTTAGVLISGPTAGNLDWERIASIGDGHRPLDSAALDEYEALTGALWRAFGAAESKASVAPLADRHLATLTNALRLSHPSNVHRRLCAAAGNLLQLRGEIAFDANRYDDAARCYSLAGTASREAGSFDLWACAMTRYAYISVYERSYPEANEMLDAAARLAANGDSELSTRHWVESVRAQALAGLGRFDECQRALDAADGVHNLTGVVHNGGWLRFDGARTTEERATCYVTLRRPDQAEPLLHQALDGRLSIRRRGSALTDLATLGVYRSDVAQVVFYGAAALDAERQSRSGVLKQKLRTLQTQLTPFGGDPHVQHLQRQITATLTSAV